MAQGHAWRRLRSSSIGFFACGLTACVVQMPDTPPAHAISGIVRNANGAVQGDITVILGGATQASTVTDANGRYIFEGLAPGKYTVTPSQGGYTCSPAEAAVTVGTADETVPDFSARLAARIWTVGGDAGGITILGWNGHAWSEVATGPAGVLNGIWGTSADDAWAVGLEIAGPIYDGIIMHWDGAAWSAASIGTSGTSMYRGWSASPDDVWNVGVDGFGGFVAHRQDAAWVKVSTGWAPNDAWGSGADDIWAVGYRAVQHWDGKSWTSVPVPAASDLRAVHGTAWNDVWAVGSEGTALHWNGGGWASVQTGTNATLRGVWGSTASDVWALGTCSLVPGTIRDCDSQAGSDAVIVHWDGRVWSRVASGTRAWLNAVWGRSARDVWSVGVSGTILHWNGLAWTGTSSGSRSADLRGIWGADRAP